MTVATPATLSGLARALVQQERLRESEAERIAAEAKPDSGGFVGQLIASGRMKSREDPPGSRPQTFGYPLIDLDSYSDEHFARDAIDPRDAMRSHQVLALLRRGNRLAVALADPTNLRALDEIRFQTGMTVNPVVVEADKLAAMVGKLTEKTETALQNLMDDELSLEFEDENAIDAAADAAAAAAEVEQCAGRQVHPEDPS